MKKLCLLAGLFLFFCVNVYAQKIQYSRQTFGMMYSDDMQLVANIKGHHHVLCFNLNKKPAIYIFNEHLQLLAKKEIDRKLGSNADVRLIPFNDFYLLYVHLNGTFLHELYRIDAEGNVTPLTNLFQQFVDKELNKSMSTLQLFNRGNKLYIVAHTYYDRIKKMGSSVAQLDKELNPVLIRKVLYDFNGDVDVLRQADLSGNFLLILKTSKGTEEGNALDLVKIDLADGQLLSHSFFIGSHIYTNPAFRFNEKDSSLLVYATVQDPSYSAASKRTVLVNQLDYNLHELTPANLLKSQFRTNTAATYLLFEGASLWLNLQNNIRLQKEVRSQSFPGIEGEDGLLGSNRTRKNVTTGYFTGSNQPTAIRFTVLNKELKAVNDSVIENKERVYDIQPRPFAQFSYRNKAYLFLIQNFSSNSRGLFAISSDNNGKLISKDIAVFDKYEYLLTKMQAVKKDYVILPYTYKNEVGLVKITIE